MRKSNSNSQFSIPLVAGIIIVITCFAANSLIARVALLGEKIDPYSFTAIRLLSGALALLPILFFSKPSFKEIKKTFSNRPCIRYLRPCFFNSLRSIRYRLRGFGFVCNSSVMYVWSLSCQRSEIPDQRLYWSLYCTFRSYFVVSSRCQPSPKPPLRKPHGPFRLCLGCVQSYGCPK